MTKVRKCHPLSTHCGHWAGVPIGTDDRPFGDVHAASGRGPNIRATWRSFVVEYADEPELPLYIALGELAQHLIELKQRGDTQGFDKVFDVVERWHTEGDSYVSEAASIGFLESLQNLLGGNDRRKHVRGVRASDFEPYLGPATRRWWEKLYRFWEGDTAALRFDT